MSLTIPFRSAVTVLSVVTQNPMVSDTKTVYLSAVLNRSRVREVHGFLIRPRRSQGLMDKRVHRFISNAFLLLVAHMYKAADVEYKMSELDRS